MLLIYQLCYYQIGKFSVNLFVMMIHDFFFFLKCMYIFRIYVTLPPVHMHQNFGLFRVSTKIYWFYRFLPDLSVFIGFFFFVRIFNFFNYIFIHSYALIHSLMMIVGLFHHNQMMTVKKNIFVKNGV